MGGRGIMMPLKAYCEKKGVQILMEHKVTDVYKNAQGRMIGARVEAGNKVINVRARKSEVLAGGNFKSNIAMRRSRSVTSALEFSAFQPPETGSTFLLWSTIQFPIDVDDSPTAVRERIRPREKMET